MCVTCFCSTLCRTSGIHPAQGATTLTLASALRTWRMRPAATCGRLVGLGGECGSKDVASADDEDGLVADLPGEEEGAAALDWRKVGGRGHGDVKRRGLISEDSRDVYCQVRDGNLKVSSSIGCESLIYPPTPQSYSKPPSPSAIACSSESSPGIISLLGHAPAGDLSTRIQKSMTYAKP